MLASQPSIPPKRKSRKARIGTASDGANHIFEPIEADWSRMESALCAPLSLEDRDEIQKLVTSYLLFEPFERTAPFVVDVEKRLNKIQKAVKTFWLTLQESGQEPDPILREANFYADSLLEYELGKLGTGNIARNQDLIRFLTNYVIALNNAKQRLNSPTEARHVEGDCWEDLVRGLSRWFGAHGLPTGVAKDVDKGRSDKPSAFVAFVRELQLSWPMEHRRHMASDAALAEGISVARRKGSRKINSSPD